MAFAYLWVSSQQKFPLPICQLTHFFGKHHDPQQVLKKNPTKALLSPDLSQLARNSLYPVQRLRRRMCAFPTQEMLPFGLCRR
jgi:hypothetical protein